MKPDFPDPEKRFFWLCQLVFSGYGLGFLAWRLTDKFMVLLPSHPVPEINDWAALFFHPNEGGLLNYAVVCVVLFAFGLALYWLDLAAAPRPITGTSRPGCLDKYVFGISIFLLPVAFYDKTFLVMILLFLSPLLYLFPRRS